MKYLAMFSLTLLALAVLIAGSTVAQVQVPLVFQTGSSPLPGDTSLTILIQTSTDSLFNGNLTQSGWLKCQPDSQFTYNAFFPGHYPKYDLLLEGQAQSRYNLFQLVICLSFHSQYQAAYSGFVIDTCFHLSKCWGR